MVKIGIIIDEKQLEPLDELVASKLFANRSKAIQDAVEGKLLHVRRERYLKECAKLNAKEEVEMAEEWAEGEKENWLEE